MAEKRLGSILGRLRGLRPAARQETGIARDAAKRPELPRSADPQHPLTDAGADEAAPTDKKKNKPQPWYRHRKRW